MLKTAGRSLNHSQRPQSLAVKLSYLRTLRYRAVTCLNFSNDCIKTFNTSFQGVGQVIRPYTIFHNLAESCVFTKQSPPPIFCPKFRFSLNLASFSRSYRVILPSSLSIIISRLSALTPIHL